MIILLRIVCTVRITSSELPPMAVQYTGHMRQTETRDNDTALPWKNPFLILLWIIVVYIWRDFEIKFNYLGTELNELERLLNDLKPVQILNHRFKTSRIFNVESVIQDLNHGLVVGSATLLQFIKFDPGFLFLCEKIWD